MTMTEMIASTLVPTPQGQIRLLLPFLELAALVGLTHKELHEQNLHCVRLEADADHLRLIACTGQSIGVIRSTGSLLMPARLEPHQRIAFNIPAELIRRLLCRLDPNKDHVQLDWKPKTGALTLSHGRSTWSEQVTTDYPAWAHSFAHHDHPHQSAGIDLRHLLPFQMVANALTKSPQISFRLVAHSAGSAWPNGLLVNLPDPAKPYYDAFAGICMCLEDEPCTVLPKWISAAVVS